MDATSVLPLNALERDLIREINILRTNPRGYAKILEKERKPHYNDKVWIRRGEWRREDVEVQTVEGVAACDEAIASLNSATPSAALALSLGLTLSAKRTVNDCGPAGRKNADSTSFFDDYGKLNAGGTAVGAHRFTLWIAFCFILCVIEVADYGGLNAKEILLSLIICDGDSSRSERNDLLDERWTVMGVAAGKHAQYSVMSVVNFATRFIDKAQVKQSPLASNLRGLWECNEL